MTVDDLIDLTEGLLHSIGLDLKQLRDLGAPAMADDLTDEQFLLAVRFLAGERPPATAGGLVDPAPRRIVPIVSDDVAAERLARLEELEEDLPPGPIDLGDGVTLP